MPLTRIVVQAEDDRSSEARVRIAAALAAEFKAALVGVVADADMATALAGVPVSRTVENLVTMELQTRRSDAAMRFRRVAEMTVDRSSLLNIPGDLVTSLLDASLVADLLVIGNDPGPQESGPSNATQIVLGASCPVLVVPRGCAKNFMPRRILVGWKATAPTARAVTGALPLLQRAGAVLLAHVGERVPVRPGAPTTQDAANWLQQHDVVLNTVELPPDPDDAGHALLDEADRFGADLIVAGAFARSPFRERLLGGATATLLAESELPLLLAH